MTPTSLPGGRWRGSRALPADQLRTTTYPLTIVQRQLLARQDARLRRCWWCAEWAYDRDDCKTCAAPAERVDLYRETS